MGILNYIPERGDIVKLDLSPTKGHEQSGYRPMLVVTLKKYNHLSGLMLICPITRTVRDGMFEVLINTAKARGVALSDQIRTIDWKARKVKYIGKAPHETVAEVCYKLGLLIKGE
ncbi:MAG: transcriptional modulator of MazE/toxin MazF [Parcubacteria group bacterium GW2011_GWA1_49_11]|nr:MAG: transcriptional modulator of MazE/toxin MazF [Parcubacteria group bacterium GW2011_GWA1_49_11]